MTDKIAKCKECKGEFLWITETVGRNGIYYDLYQCKKCKRVVSKDSFNMENNEYV